jgi:tetratricopeptide (TPR) repeat protein
LYYFGIGVPFFALLGCGALLASDAVSPEFLPRPLRFSATGFVALVAAMSLYFGFTEVVRARLRADLALGDRAGAQAGSELLASIAPLDGEAVYLRARAASSVDERLRLTELASVLAPSPRNLRSLAREQGARGDNEAAISTLNRALLADPRSLPTLSALLNQYRAAENVEGARQVAERLIAVEPTPYFQVRSLPEIVPTETYAARLYLASITTSAKDKIALLSGCVKGYAAYANTTVPTVRRSLKDEPTGNFAGETLQSVNENLRRGQLAAEELAKAYYSVDDAAGGADAAAAARDFAAKLAI